MSSIAILEPPAHAVFRDDPILHEASGVWRKSTASFRRRSNGGLIFGSKLEQEGAPRDGQAQIAEVMAAMGDGEATSPRRRLKITEAKSAHQQARTSSCEDDLASQSGHSLTTRSIEIAAGARDSAPGWNRCRGGSRKSTIDRVSSALARAEKAGAAAFGTGQVDLVQTFIARNQ